MAAKRLTPVTIVEIGPRGARFLKVSSLPSLLVKGWLVDGIVWVAVGVSLMAQAGFLMAMNWWPSDVPPPSDGVPPSVAGGIVAFAFVVLGVGALGVGVRRLVTARRSR
jgi:hypothetical protein